MLDELWVPIEGFPLYEISNYGQIMNVETGRARKPQLNKDGYYQIKLCRADGQHWFYIHRLVAQAFFLNYSDDRNVRFKNGQRHDYAVLNLTMDMDSALHGKTRGSSGG